MMLASSLRTGCVVLGACLGLIPPRAVAQQDPTPPVPTVLESEARIPATDVREQAGVGGPLAYASRSVLEVGGSGSLIRTAARTLLRFAPFVGWFVFDGIRLSYMHEIYVAKVDGDARLATTMLLGISAHIRLNDRVLFAIGSGQGALYNGDRWGFALRPSVGLDVLIGRSAVFHPSFLLTWATTDLVDLAGASIPDDRLAVGLDITYSAMF